MIQTVKFAKVRLVRFETDGVYTHSFDKNTNATTLRVGVYGKGK